MSMAKVAAIGVNYNQQQWASLAGSQSDQRQVGRVNAAISLGAQEGLQDDALNNNSTALT